jgi:hypothetical protein
MKKGAAVLLILCVLFVPFALAQTEQKLPDLPDSAVTIPWSDFKELIKDLIAPTPPPPPPPAPPADYAVSTASYSGRIEGKSAVFSASFTLVVLAEKKWVEIPLLSDGLAVSDVSMDGASVTLAAKNGYYTVITDKPGKHTVSLKFFVPADTESGNDSLQVPLPRVPSSTLSLTVPRPGLDFEVVPAHWVRVSGSGGATTVETVLPVTDHVAISWSPAVRGEVSGALRVQAQVNTLISIGEGIMKGVTTVTYDILHGSVSSFTITVPTGIEIIDVSGDAVREWKVTPDEKRSTIHITAGFAASGKTSVVLLFEKNMGGTTADVEVPEIEVKDVIRETGYVAVTSSTKVGVQEKESKNLAGLDTTELPPELVSASENPILFSYKYLKHPWELALSVVTYQDIPSLTTVVTKESLASLLTIRGDLVTRAVFEVKNNVKQFMRVVLPKGSELWSAYVSDRPVKPSVDKDGTILIPLDRSTRSGTALTSFSIEIVYITKTNPLSALLGRRVFAAPVTDIQTDAVSWTLYLPERYSWRHVGNDMEAVAPAPVIYDVGMDINAPLGAPLEEMTTSDEMYRGYVEKKEEKPQPQVYMEKNIYAEGLSSIGGGVGMKGVLPVRLDIPFAGRSVAFSKAIVGPGEESILKFRYAGGVVSGVLFAVVVILCAVLFGSVVIFAHESLKERRIVVDRRLAAGFVVSLVLVVLVAVFLIMDASAFSFGLFIGLVVGGSLFVRDLIAKIKEIALEAKQARLKEEQEKERQKKRTEKGR